MTGDELALALYAEQGFLLITSDRLRKIGDIAPPSAALDTKVNIPLRIVAESSAEEFNKQAALAERFMPGCNGSHRWPYCYRVEAAD